MDDFKDWKRTCFCGDVSLKDKSVILNGWIRGRRDHGGLLFWDLWDKTDTVQVVLDPKKFSDVKLSYDSVISVKGKVRSRPEGMKNPDQNKGDLELVAESVKLLSACETLPFQEGDTVTEELALKYRYLDLRRRKDLRGYLEMRAKALQIIRKTLDSSDFFEVETPLLYKSTPEGARDYLVPSRVQKARFYALPQSPQMLKQLLMIAGWDKYYQIARCFRDEDLRSDRQPEFTQLDLEMSFVTEDDIYQISEKIIRALWKELKQESLSGFSVMTYKEAKDRFGTDKPDLRSPLELKTLSKEVIENSGLKILKSPTKALFVPSYLPSRSEFSKLEEEAKALGAKGLLQIQKTESGEYKSPLANKVKSLDELYEQGGGKSSGVCFYVSDKEPTVNKVLSTLIQKFNRERGWSDTSKTEFVWIVDFPLFEKQEQGYTCTHHPFTAPKGEIKGDMTSVYARAYDLVCNGQELGGGSIRNHQADVQKKILDTLGMPAETQKEQFGFFIQALKQGAPPHGGIAFGIERLIMLLAGTDNIRDVFAFPKTTSGSCLMSEAPSQVDKDQLKELGLDSIK